MLITLIGGDTIKVPASAQRNFDEFLEDDLRSSFFIAEANKTVFKQTMLYVDHTRTEEDLQSIVSNHPETSKRFNQWGMKREENDTDPLRAEFEELHKNLNKETVEVFHKALVTLVPPFVLQQYKDNNLVDKAIAFEVYKTSKDVVLQVHKETVRNASITIPDLYTEKEF